MWPGPRAPGSSAADARHCRQQAAGSRPQRALPSFLTYLLTCLLTYLLTFAYLRACLIPSLLNSFLTYLLACLLAGRRQQAVDLGELLDLPLPTFVESLLPRAAATAATAATATSAAATSAAATSAATTSAATAAASDDRSEHEAHHHLLQSLARVSLDASASVDAALSGAAYALPAATVVECFEGSQAAAAEAALVRMETRVVGGEGVLPAVGVDAEWVAGHGVSLLQLAVPQQCVLLRMHTFDASQLPAALGRILADRTLLKIGVGVGNDLRLVCEQYNLKSSSAVELPSIAAREGYTAAGLQRLCRDVLGAHLEKGLHLSCSDWEV